MESQFSCKLIHFHLNMMSGLEDKWSPQDSQPALVKVRAILRWDFCEWQRACFNGYQNLELTKTIQLKARSRSAMRSSSDSIPTDSRSRFELIPNLRRRSSGTEAWVIFSG